LVLSLVLLPAAVPAQADPLARDALVYVARVGDAEIGRESVTLAEDGWTADGGFDLLGTRKGKYRARLVRASDGAFDCEVTGDANGKEATVRAAYAGGELTVKVIGAKRERATRVTGEVPVPYENLLWATLIELGRALAAREDAGVLLPGAKIAALAISSGAEFAIELRAARVLQHFVEGAPAALRVYDVRLPPGVDMTLVCNRSGVPLRIEVPAQKLSVAVEGLYSVPSPLAQPATLVDKGAWRERLSAPAFPVDIDRAVKIAMRDGVELEADVYRPIGEGRFPAIVARTPYNRITEGALKGAWYAQRGFVFVAQDVRGRFGSGGEWFPFVHEERDGSDTLDWIASQEWSNGRIGMLGASYVGLVQWLAAKSGNPHLTCIVPQVSPPDPHENIPYEGGVFLLSAAWWAKVLDGMKKGTDWRVGVDWKKVMATLPLTDLDKSLALDDGSFLDVWLAHPPHDREFWEHASYQDAFSKITVPALHVTGWYDGDQPGALQGFEGMRRAAKTAGARAGQLLVVGPWTHMFNSSRSIGALDFGDEAVVDLDARVLRFFDRYLKDIDNGIDREDPVLVFTMGTNRWHFEKDWPLPQTRFTELLLTSGGNARARDGDGRLVLDAPDGGAAADTYRYDPMDQADPDIDFNDLSGAQATRDLSGEPDRDDDLDYRSAPLAEPCEIVGPVRVVLFVSSDAADTDFAAILYRETPAGEVFAIRAGIQRLRYAADPRRDAPVEPGTVARVEIDCWATALRLAKGERIGLRILSSLWPGYARNLNTLEPQATATEAAVATNTVHHGPDRRSHVLLPVVPRDGAAGLRF
jgi:hypothetical protein